MPAFIITYYAEKRNGRADINFTILLYGRYHGGGHCPLITYYDEMCNGSSQKKRRFWEQSGREFFCGNFFETFANLKITFSES